MRSASKRGLRKSGRRAGGAAHTEIEVKLRIADEKRLLSELARLGAKMVRGRVHEMNTLYDTAEGNLSRRGRMLRLRVERPAARARVARRRRKASSGKGGMSALLTFKGPAKGPKASKPGLYKMREERELRISEPKEARVILEALGVQPWFRYEKFRTEFELPRMRGLKVALDETPMGVFLELEGRPEEINRAAGMLGYDRSGYISKSYGALFMEERGLAREGFHNEPVPFSGMPDMVFGGSRAARAQRTKKKKQTPRAG